MVTVIAEMHGSVLQLEIVTTVPTRDRKLLLTWFR